MGLTAAKERLQRYYRQALERCLEGFGRLAEEEWQRRAAGEWTAKDYLAHLVICQEERGNRLTAQALAGEPASVPGLANRHQMHEYNRRALATVRHLPGAELLGRLRSAFQDHLDTLASVAEANLERPIFNPGWHRPGTLWDLFNTCYLHLSEHYQDIRRAAPTKLPHWIGLSAPDEIHYLMQQTFHFLSLIYDGERGNNLAATFLFTIEGEGGGQWAIRVAHGQAETLEGHPQEVSVEVRTTPETWMDLSTKELSGVKAVTTRKAHISGNLFLAMRLDSLFEAG